MLLEIYIGSFTSQIAENRKKTRGSIMRDMYIMSYVLVIKILHSPGWVEVTDWKNITIRIVLTAVPLLQYNNIPVITQVYEKLIFCVTYHLESPEDVPSKSQQVASSCHSREFCGRPLNLLLAGLSLSETTR